MPIRQSRLEGILVVTPGPKLTASTGAEALTDLVQQALDDGMDKVLFDLSDVAFIDSLGVGQVANCYRKVTETGGKPILCGLQPRVLTVLRMANLHLVLDIRDKTSGEGLWGPRPA